MQTLSRPEWPRWYDVVVGNPKPSAFSTSGNPVAGCEGPFLSRTEYGPGIQEWQNPLGRIGLDLGDRRSRDGVEGYQKPKEQHESKGGRCSDMEEKDIKSAAQRRAGWT